MKILGDELQMKKLIEVLTLEMETVFAEAGYDKKYAKVTISSRPDLCEYQCSGALSAAKEYKKAPFVIADEIVGLLQENKIFSKIEMVKPGFINLDLAETFLAEYVSEMQKSEKFGMEEKESKTIIVDYGGPNVAKPLHVGHLRPAIIGESVKRIMRYRGDNVLGDIHMGDWGYPMGLIITEFKKRQPDWVYFKEEYEGEYPEEALFTVGELEEIYPMASAYAKEHEKYKEAALEATYLLQNGLHRGYRALWEKIMEISVKDLKRNYSRLNVEFDLWKGESDVQPYIADMVAMLKEGGYARLDEGALVVDVKEESDTKEIPPCMILKSDGAALYGTTDLATLIEREKLYTPDEVIYVVDKRQELHFIQVFRTALKAKIVRDETKLIFMGFGTMNGADGKPFKTRDGGVMRLEMLIGGIEEEVCKKIRENRDVTEEAARETAKIVGLAALKYGDLSNQTAKDYVFDTERFTSFEGNTGPYVLYTVVRIKSILTKYYADNDSDAQETILQAVSKSEKALMLEAAKFTEMLEMAYKERAPHRICAYLFSLSDVFNHFYHETKILAEEDRRRKESYIALLKLTKEILETAVYLLGFEIPERM